jgi:hypothetical protein
MIPFGPDNTHGAVSSGSVPPTRLLNFKSGLTIIMPIIIMLVSLPMPVMHILISMMIIFLMSRLILQIIKKDFLIENSRGLANFTCSILLIT